MPRYPAFALAAALALAAQPATALSIDRALSGSASAFYTIGAHTVDDADAADAPFALLAGVSAEAGPNLLVGVDGLGRGGATAAIAHTGISLLSAGGRTIVTADTSLPHVLQAFATQTIVETLPARAGRFGFYYSFSLTGMFVELWDDYGLNGIGNQNIEASLRYEILLDGVSAFIANARVRGTADPARLAVSQPVGDLLDYTISPGGADGADLTVAFDDLVVDDLLLGTIDHPGGAPGETFDTEITTELSIALSLPSQYFDIGARVGMGDPLSLETTGDLVVRDVTLPQVPLPAGFWGLTCALAVMLALHRRAARASARSDVVARPRATPS